jgi:hypothetical protein
MMMMMMMSAAILAKVNLISCGEGMLQPASRPASRQQSYRNYVPKHTLFSRAVSECFSFRLGIVECDGERGLVARVVSALRYDTFGPNG